MSVNELVTKHDFAEFQQEVRQLLSEVVKGPSKEYRWLKSSEVMKILGISASGLQNLRIKGVLPYSKLGGTIYYSEKDIIAVLELNKQCER